MWHSKINIDFFTKSKETRPQTREYDFVGDYEKLQVPEQTWKVNHELYAIVSQQIKIKNQTAESLVI